MTTGTPSFDVDEIAQAGRLLRDAVPSGDRDEVVPVLEAILQAAGFGDEASLREIGLGLLPVDVPPASPAELEREERENATVVGMLRLALTHFEELSQLVRQDGGEPLSQDELRELAAEAEEDLGREPHGGGR
jgi:hypothetical protein